MNDELLEDHCPSCGHYLDSASDPLAPTARPAPFDLTVCIYCGVALEFGLDMKLHYVPLASLSDPEKANIAILRQAMREIGPPPSARQSRN